MDIFLIQNNEQEQADVDDIVARDEMNKGILPLEMYKLIQRRREMKELIKEKKKNQSDEQFIQVKSLFLFILQYDIRQKAYQLMANGLYDFSIQYE